MLATCTLIAAVLAAAPGRAPRAAVGTFTGPGGAAVRRQLVEPICASLRCVSPKAALSRGKPDWKKARRERVGFVLTGRIPSSKKALVLSILGGPGKPVLQRSYRLQKGKLSPEALAEAVRDVLEVTGAAPEPEPAAEAPAPPPEPAPLAELMPPEPSPEPSPEPPPAPAPAPREPEPEPATDIVARSEEAPPPREVRRLEVELGTALVGRQFEYSGVETSNLRWYSADLIVSPRLEVELFPLAFIGGGPAAKLGLEASFASAVGHRSQRNNGVSYPTSMTQLEATAKYLLALGESASLSPLVGYRRASFSVGGGDDGSTLDGLPGIAYSTAVAGLGAEVTWAGGSVVTFGELSYLAVLSSGEIVSPAYFPRGAARGLEGRLGIGVRVLPSLELRASGQLTRYGFTFQSQPEDTYVAGGATDQYLGGTVGIRYLL